MALFSGLKQKKSAVPASAVVIARENHSISRKLISDNALKVLYRLRKEGYAAMLVGGGVRDLLLGLEPKDFDIVTDAKPEQIRRCFVNARIIGKRFRLVHVIFKNEIIEVSTFRASDAPRKKSAKTKEGMILQDNRYGSFSEDACRRDFTVNAFYYNIDNFNVIDCHNGMDDLQKGLIRMIGDPLQRYREDPVRMLRAIRFAAKLGFRLEPSTQEPIFSHRDLLGSVSPARLYSEYLKLFFGGYADACFKCLHQYQLLDFLLPDAQQNFDAANYETLEHYYSLLMQQTDARFINGKSVSPSFFLSVILWPLVALVMSEKNNLVDHPNILLQRSAEVVLRKQLELVAFPGHQLSSAKDIWLVSQFLLMRKRTKVMRMVEHTRFRAAIDFLELRAILEPELKSCIVWWRDFYEADAEKRLEMQKALPAEKKPKKKKKKKVV